MTLSSDGGGGGGVKGATMVPIRETAGVYLEFWPMPSLRDRAQDGVFCTFTTRTSATAAEFARSSQLSSSRPGQAVRSVREGGKDRPSKHKNHLGLVTLLQPTRRASVLGHLSSFGLIGAYWPCPRVYKCFSPTCILRGPIRVLSVCFI